MSNDLPSSAPLPTPRPKSHRRIWWFRLGAVGFGLLLLVLFEGVCWLCDWGTPSQGEDPFVGFREIHPLFEVDDAGENYVISPARLKFFAPESFPAQKGENTFRIFCLGGSTVQGRPWSKETSFTTFLELGLDEADGRRDWEVVNCGGISYASYRLVPILKECLHYEPDLVVLCTGHNEFLEDRTYDHIKNAPAVLKLPQKLFGGLRTFTLMREAVWSRPELSAETEPILDYHDSLKAYDRDPDWQRGVVLHYESNLRRMIALCREADVPVVVVLPPSNLGDCPPFKSQHKSGLSAEDEQRFAELMAEARGLFRSDLDAAMLRLKAAVTLDDRYAAGWYELGQCYRTRGIASQARECLVRARDEDICPLRMITPLEEALKRVVADTETPWLDAHALLEADCRHQILDARWLIDHVHPHISGYQKIADALLEKLAEEGIAQPSDNWQTRAQKVYKQHLDQLDDFYFAKGLRNREAVRGWAQGRAAGPLASERFPERLRETAARSQGKASGRRQPASHSQQVPMTKSQ